MYCFVEYDDGMRQVEWWLEGLFDRLCEKLKKDRRIEARHSYLGLPDRPFVLRNGRTPAELCHKMEFTRGVEAMDCAELKRDVRDTLDTILRDKPYKLRLRCGETVSSLTARPVDFAFEDGPTVRFGFDLLLSLRGPDGACLKMARETPKGGKGKAALAWKGIGNADDAEKRLRIVTSSGAGDELAEEYLKARNECLRRGDAGRTPCECLIGAADKVYDALRRSGRI